MVPSDRKSLSFTQQYFTKSTKYRPRTRTVLSVIGEQIGCPWFEGCRVRDWLSQTNHQPNKVLQLCFTAAQLTLQCHRANKRHTITVPLHPFLTPVLPFNTSKFYTLHFLPCTFPLPVSVPLPLRNGVKLDYERSAITFAVAVAVVVCTADPGWLDHLYSVG